MALGSTKAAMSSKGSPVALTWIFACMRSFSKGDTKLKSLRKGLRVY